MSKTASSTSCPKKPAVIRRDKLPSWRAVVEPGEIYMSTQAVTLLTPEQRTLTGSKNPLSPQPAKRRPYLVLGVNQDGTFTAVPITSRAGKGWEGLGRKDRLRFLPIGICPEGISRPVVHLESVTSCCRGGSHLLTSAGLLFLDVIETFRPEAMCGCQGKVSEDGLQLVKNELVRNLRKPQVKEPAAANPFAILAELLDED
ncbi:hypothetical protein DFP73DRAFT_587341 [Morchella snyderi]|nr:hypothetical protein DFP73DRAFT_587341 [Morchella snyderi]